MRDAIELSKAHLLVTSRVTYPQPLLVLLYQFPRVKLVQGGWVMSLDFTRLKAIPISDVVGKYGIQLRFRGEWGSAICPLPSHKKGEKEKTFSVNTLQNYWKCFSASCNESAGCKGGDTINFVALMDGSTQLAAAKKLAEWFNIGETKSAPLHIVRRREEKPEMQKTTIDDTTSAVA